MKTRNLDPKFVPKGCECPKCQEKRYECIDWNDDVMLVCHTCENVYYAPGDEPKL